MLIWNIAISFEDAAKAAGLGVGIYAVVKILNNERMFNRFLDTVDKVIAHPAVITLLKKGCVNIQFLTIGNASREALLEAYFSKKLLQEYQKVFELINGEKFVVSKLVLTEVGVVLAKQQDFDDIRQEAVKMQKKFNGMQQNENEIVFSYHPLLQDKDKIMIQKFSTEDDKEAIMKKINDMEIIMEERESNKVVFQQLFDQPTDSKKESMDSDEGYSSSEFSTSSSSAEDIVNDKWLTLQKYQHPQLGEVSIKWYGTFGLIQRKKKEIEQLPVLAVMRGLKHKNIVEVFGFTQLSTLFGVVMEYVAGGNLEDLLMSSDHHDIPWLLRHRLFLDIADGLLYLHHYDERKVFAHGDLKPQNILLTKDLKVKIAGFGSTEIVAKSGVASTSRSTFSNIAHTFFYTAPEIIKNPLILVKPSADLYSVAMLGYEILTRHQVFEDANPDLVVNAIIREGLKPHDTLLLDVKLSLEGKPQDLSIFKLLESIIKKCWDFQPEKRLNIRDVREKLDEHFQVAYDEILNAELEPLKQSIASRTDSRKSSTQTVNLREVYAQAQASTNAPSSFLG